MLEANPGVDVYLPKSGSTLVVPQQLILPATVRQGIVINVAEMRLYYYPPEGTTVDVLPIGIGQAGRETPRNWVTAVERKQEAPTWTPTTVTPGIPVSPTALQPARTRRRPTVKRWAFTPDATNRLRALYAQ